MRKVLAIFVALILVCTPLSVQAASQRSLSIQPSISYSGNTATCTVRIIGNSTAEHLEATIKLWRGELCIATWNETGNGYIFFSETAAATQGNIYTMTIDLSINNIAQDTVSISKRYA